MAWPTSARITMSRCWSAPGVTPPIGETDFCRRLSVDLRSAYRAGTCRFDPTARCPCTPPCPGVQVPEKAQRCVRCVQFQRPLLAHGWVHASSRAWSRDPRGQFQHSARQSHTAWAAFFLCKYGQHSSDTSALHRRNGRRAALWQQNCAPSLARPESDPSQTVKAQALGPRLTGRAAGAPW